MPTQYPYPETDWAVGKMAKAGPRGMDPGREYRELEGQRKSKESRVSQAEQQFPEMDPQEWQSYFSRTWEIYGMGSRKIDPSKTSPDGFIIDKNHPQIPELSKDFDTFSIPKTPDESWGGRFLFMKPRQSEPLTSEAPGMGRVA